MKTIIVKLTKAGPTTGPFDIISNGETLASNISRKNGNIVFDFNSPIWSFFSIKFYVP